MGHPAARGEARGNSYAHQKTVVCPLLFFIILRELTPFSLRLTPFRLGCGQLELANPLQVDVLTSNPKVTGVLHGEPTLGRAANSLGKAQRHLWGDPTGALEDATEGGRRDIELFRELSTTDAIGLKVDLGDELTGVRRVVHSH